MLLIVIYHIGGRLFQVRDGINCGHEWVQDSVTLCQIAFASKGLSNTQEHYSKIEITVLLGKYVSSLTMSH